MAKTLKIDIPHQLGRDGARARIDGGLDKLNTLIPGFTTGDYRWDGDVFGFSASGMGQSVPCRLAVADTQVRLEMDLPLMFAMFAGPIREKLERDAPRLLQ